MLERNDVVCVIAATDDDKVNRQVSEQAQARQIPANVVDSPELCSFIMPSMVDRDPLQIAISTGGVSPVLARILRAKLESSIPGGYGALVRIAEEFRTPVKQALPDVDSRRRFWEEVLEGRVAELVFAGRHDDARNELRQRLRDFDASQPSFYYLRAVENPSPRWSLLDCLKIDAADRPAACAEDSEVPKIIQELGWSSPIWYQPEQ